MNWPDKITMNALCELSGAKPTQVEHWCRMGIIVPMQESAGRGSYRVFSKRNVVDAARALYLAEIGLPTKQMKAVLR